MRRKESVIFFADCVFGGIIREDEIMWCIKMRLFYGWIIYKKMSGFVDKETQEKPVILVTYNMSFASDKGMSVNKDNKFLNYPSEMSFLKKMENDISITDKRQYWINAAALLKKFVDEKKSTNSLVIGLQEMNDTQQETASETWTKYIEQQIVDSNYKFAVDHLYVIETQQPALMTIWDSVQFGNIIANQIYELAQKIDNPSEYNPHNKDTLDSELSNYKTQFALKNSLSTTINQSGRPIMFTYTDKGYLFINIQATNNAPDSANEYKIQLGFIQNKFMLFLDKLIAETKITSYDKIEPSNIFVIGDFNDRYGGLGKYLLLSPDFKQYTLKFDGEAPKSCCHNLDSSCKADPIVVEKHNNSNAKDCKFDSKFKLVGPRTNEEIALMEEDGNVENYRYVGDYCFAFNGGELKMYPKRENNVQSTESDHEMVYMVVAPSASSSGTAEENTIPQIEEAEPSKGGRRLKRNTKKGLPKKRRASRKKRGARRTHKKH